MIGRFTVEFISSETEISYRQSYLKKDNFQGTLALLLCIIPLGAFMFFDILLFGHDINFFYLLLGRGMILVALLAVALFLRLSRSYEINDIVIFFFWLAVTAAILYIYHLRPKGYSPSAVYDIIIILAIYLVLPGRFILQVIPALIYTVAYAVFLLHSSEGVDRVILLRIFLSLTIANMLGIFMSWRIHYLRRIEFITLRKEKVLRTELEEALKNVRTLSGLLPICSHCHKIRNDEGYWKSIENYIEEHSEAQFTHSICHECAEKLYGSEKWFGKSKDGNDTGS